MMPHYIRRKLAQLEKVQKYQEDFPFLLTESWSLLDLIFKGTKNIVLLGDGGAGKSTELKELTRQLISKENLEYIPIYIELDNYVDEDVIDYVKNKVGEESLSLLDYDNSKLLFLFDEFDRVMDKNIAVRKIKTFMESHSKSYFVIACRTNFYSSGQFDNFSALYILELTREEIKQYATEILGHHADSFLSQLAEHSLVGLAENPFFLNHLVIIYKYNNKLSEKRSDIFSKIISISLENDEKRLATKYDLSQAFPAKEIENKLRYISIIMETIQKNILTTNELKTIVPEEFERSIIQELTLIKKSFYKEGDYYQFQHNNFQEYMAAQVLAGEKLKVILEYISFPYFKKINPSWANTISFLCQLREENDLLDYLLKNEPELTLKFEVDRVGPHREKIFRTIFEKYSDKNIWFNRDRINYDDLAKFATESDFDYLMRYARSKEHFSHRYNAIEILGELRPLSDRSIEALRELLILCANDENEHSSVRHSCFYSLSSQKLGSSETIDALKHLKNSDEDMVLAGLYHLIEESEYSDQYIDILLEGIDKMRYQPGIQKTNLADIGINVSRGLEKVKSAKAIKAIIRHFTKTPRDLEEFKIERSVERIMGNAVKAYEMDSSIYEDIKEMTAAAENAHANKQVANIVKLFFCSTGTTLRYFKELYEKGIEQNYGLMAQIADKQSIGFLADEYLAGKLKEATARTFFNFISFKNPERKEELLEEYNRKTNDSIKPVAQRDYNKEREEQFKREIEILFSKDEFLKEVEKIYDIEGKEEINYGDVSSALQGIYDNKNYNTFVIRELMKIFETNPNVKWKQEVLKEEINKWDYELYSIRHIFDLLYHMKDMSLQSEQLAMIKDYFLRNITKVDFKEALKTQGSGVQSDWTAIMLWFFLWKYNYECTEETLLDLLSYDWIINNQFLGIEYIEDRLSIDKIKKRILENLNKGIKIEQVLKNHIDFCKRHQCFEAQEKFVDVAVNPHVSAENRLLALETVANFPGSSNFLERMLGCDEEKLFVRAAEILIEKSGNSFKKSKVRKELHHKLLSNDVLALAAAVLLVKEQDLDGIRYYAKHVKDTKIFKERNPLLEIKSIEALPILMDLLSYSYEHQNQIQQNEWFRLDYTIIRVLTGIAMQSHSNYNKINKRLGKFIKDNLEKYEKVKYLYFSLDEMEKAFFINYRSKITLKEAIEKTKKLHLI